MIFVSGSIIRFFSDTFINFFLEIFYIVKWYNFVLRHSRKCLQRVLCPPSYDSKTSYYHNPFNPSYTKIQPPLYSEFPRLTFGKNLFIKQPVCITKIQFSHIFESKATYTARYRLDIVYIFFITYIANQLPKFRKRACNQSLCSIVDILPWCIHQISLHHHYIECTRLINQFIYLQIVYNIIEISNLAQ